MSALRLGAFELGEEISRGGMGIVVAATHVPTGRPVALKILSGDRSNDPVFLRSFRREVRSVAALEHPRIITLYDFGLVGPGEAEGHPDLMEGAPWIAMELASFGSLHSFPALKEWRDLQSVLFDILDGLAHAHARDIIHRDLKPGNILLVPDGGLIRCKISDFGIAHARGAATSTHEVFASAAGTPWFMAPEQVESQWRDYGPWTDLYALGAVAFQLVTGRPPFDGDSAVEVARKQLFERPPPIEPILAVPDGLSDWIQRLLSKETGLRYQRAADALWALQKISPDNPSGMRVPVSRRPVLVDTGADTIPGPPPEMAQVNTALTTLTFDRGFDFEAFPSLEEISSPTTLAVSMPPIPDEWRPRKKKTEGMLSGAGLGLFGLRETPFVNRNEECDLIWSALRHVANRRVAQGIVLQGPGGVGKARVCDWMARRAHEVGAAKVLVARHGPMSGGFDGIRRMLDEYAGTTGLDLERTYERLRHQLMADAIDPIEIVRYRAAALARFLRPGLSSARVPPVRIAGPDELFAVLRGILVRYSRNRPVLVVLRDVHWAPSALEFANRVLASQDTHPAPLLLLATVRDDLPEDEVLASEALEALCNRGNVVRRRLDPLDDEALGELIDGVVKLDDDLRESLVTATRGNPLFCLQLLGHWVERGELIPDESGFKKASEEPFPTDAYDLWLSRLDDVARSLDETSLLSMEVAATLGMEVDPHEWHDACRLLDYNLPPNLVDELATRGLIRRSGDTWEFSHALLRDALVDRSNREGRAAAHHSALADVLASSTVLDQLARQARHLERAGRSEEAIATMLHVADRLVEQSLFAQAEITLDRVERLRATVPGSDVLSHARILAGRGAIWSARGDLENALGVFDELMAIASTNGWAELEIRGLRGSYRVLQNLGRVEEGVERLERALRIAETHEIFDAQLRVSRSLGWMMQRRGEPEKARALLEKSIALSKELDDVGDRERAISRAALAEVLRSQGEVELAREQANASVSRMREFGDRVGLGDGLNVLAEIERKSGNLQKAEIAYREAIESYDLAGHASGDLVRANLAMLHLQRGRVVEARELLERAAESFEAFKMQYYLAFARFGLARASAELGDTESWDTLFRLLSSLDQTYYETEFVEIAIAAGRRWLEREERQRFSEALSLAQQMLAQLTSAPPELIASVEELAQEQQ